MANAKDLKGMRFGRLVCIRRSENRFKGDRVRWLCMCDCGKYVNVISDNLLRGSSTSCGCLRSSKITTHGKSKSKIYKVWCGMLQRCNNKKNSYYKNYGGRGIVVCDSWSDFSVFYDWAIKNGYKYGLTIERVDNNKGYCPDNCVFITKSEQSKNRRANYSVNIDGSVMCLYDACKHIDVDYSLVQNRIKNLGWDVDKALYTKSKSPTRCHATVLEYNGMSLNIREWSDYLKIPYKSLYGKLSRSKIRNGFKQITSQCLKEVLSVL